jgi:hypothetical protein
MTKELLPQSQDLTRWSVLRIFSSEKGEADFASDCSGKHKDGLLLKYLRNGSIERYLRSNAPYTIVA